MRIEVLTKDPLTTIYRANCISVGRKPKPGKVFTDAWVYEQLLAEHSTLEWVHIGIYDDDIRGDVASHVVRHTRGLPRHVVQSKRPDWNQGQPRPGPETPRMFGSSINPIALIEMARKRLCSHAMKETLDWMTEVESCLLSPSYDNGTEEYMLLRNLGMVLKAECEYRGGCPYGKNCCGRSEPL